ncbi:LANO_0H22848g1_1 [Lachancea nothofagi CBS 11611]|uniref:LANO_0H22848g1_1 n=1 Tax=Lachancea nothofagi CBS 11611 TaxID=1266666 RepID=A0A1G4KNJ5_9SACH|nr:LANO_0H22848g1_1 [Lachancea nothofagi CBS 11611]
MSTCPYSVLHHVSTITGSVSFVASLIAQIPQVLETYVDKTVEGLSPLFLLAWLVGDITMLAGALMTNQLKFQIVLALYFLANDLFVCGQYFYYGVLHDNKLATPGHEQINTEERMAIVRSRGSDVTSLNQRSWFAGLLFFITGARGSPLGLTSDIKIESTIGMNAGVILSWAGASCYVGARIPQLLKNYRRKSTDGLSPFLFFNMLLANITYNVSIFTSCGFLECPDKWAFTMSEMPFIVGSAGTVVFDLIYFYQHYVLYAEDMHLRELEGQLNTGSTSNDEIAPLLQLDNSH